MLLTMMKVHPFTLGPLRLNRTSFRKLPIEDKRDLDAIPAPDNIVYLLDHSDPGLLKLITGMIIETYNSW